MSRKRYRIVRPIIRIMNKSIKCIQQEHELCEGAIIEIVDDSARICECECHNNLYKLVSRMQAATNNS